jgi:hypothetical protein
MTISIQTMVGQVNFVSASLPDINVEALSPAQLITLQTKFFPLDDSPGNEIEFVPSKPANDSMAVRTRLKKYLMNEGFIKPDGNMPIKVLQTV